MQWQGSSQTLALYSTLVGSMEREGSMGEVASWLEAMGDDLLGVGLEKDDLDEAVSFIAYMEDEDEDGVLADVIQLRAVAP